MFEDFYFVVSISSAFLYIILKREQNYFLLVLAKRIFSLSDYFEKENKKCYFHIFLLKRI